MIFFDQSRPNKYSALKKELIPVRCWLRDHPNILLTKARFGTGDGSYVLGQELLDNAVILSYGIGTDKEGVSFERELSKNHLVKMFDPKPECLNVIDFPGKFTAEALTKNNFKDHCADLLGEDNILKMDVEGNEYNFLSSENLDILQEKFSQVTIEVHGLIEEIPEGWVIEEAVLDAKRNLSKKIQFFKRLNSCFFLFHMHANNHAPRHLDFPDSLELTYINRRRVSASREIDIYPIEGLDFPNFEGREEYTLDWYL